jgi:histidinol-phosphate aminotransferase
MRRMSSALPAREPPEPLWLAELARPEIRALKAYEHARWEPGLVRLHANELPWRALNDRSQAGLNRYPEPHPLTLSAALAQLYGVQPARLLATRGSDEAIDLLVRSYCRAGSDAILICPPTFGMYSVAARVQGAGIIEVPLRREAGFACDFEAVLARCAEHVKLVFLCSPNNPTGNRLPLAQLIALARALEGRALLVVDEAYVEFAAAPLEALPGLVLLRTLSKAFGLAGARCGALLGHPAVVALLRKVIQPYALTQLTIEAVFQALEPAPLEQMRTRVSAIKAERARVAAALAGLTRVRRVWPSDANFLLVEFEDASRALEAAHAAGLLVRDLRAALSAAPALRISIGTPEQNDQLLACLA